MHCLLISVLVLWLVVVENTTARNIPLASHAKAQKKREDSESTDEEPDEKEDKAAKEAKGKGKKGKKHHGAKTDMLWLGIPFVCISSIFFLYLLYGSVKEYMRNGNNGNNDSSPIGMRTYSSLEELSDSGYPPEDQNQEMEEPVEDPSGPQDRVNRTINNRNYNSMNAWDKASTGSVDSATVDSAIVAACMLDKKGSEKKSDEEREEKKGGRTSIFSFFKSKRKKSVDKEEKEKK